jgi:hypothetical protein
MVMRKRAVAMVCASLLAGAVSTAWAGAYGEPPEPEESPAAVAVAPVAEPEPEPERTMRLFAGFLTDAETARGFWVGLDLLYAWESHFGGDFDMWTTNARLAYGGEMWEAGAEIPYSWVDGPGFENDGFQDINFWGKVIPIRTDLYPGGGGLVVTAPTGDGQFSLDEWGFEPFVTGAVAAGPVSIRGMRGYTRYLDIDDSDGLTYNLGVLAPCGERVVLRGEFDGAHYFDLNADENPVSFVPGLDIAFPMGTNELILRLSAAAGLTDEASDWGIGIGFAFAQI